MLDRRKRVMTVVEQIINEVDALPPERQKEVLDFAIFLAARYAENGPRRSSRGLWAGLGFDITEEDIDQARREALMVHL